MGSSPMTPSVSADTSIVSDDVMSDDATTIRGMRSPQTRTDLTPDELEELSDQVRRLQRAVESIDQVRRQVRVEAADRVVVRLHNFLIEMKATAYRDIDPYNGSDRLVRWSVDGVGYVDGDGPAGAAVSPLDALEQFTRITSTPSDGDGWTLIEILGRLRQALDEES